MIFRWFSLWRCHAMQQDCRGIYLFHHVDSIDRKSMHRYRCVSSLHLIETDVHYLILCGGYYGNCYNNKFIRHYPFCAYLSKSSIVTVNGICLSLSAFSNHCWLSGFTKTVAGAPTALRRDQKSKFSLSTNECRKFTSSSVAGVTSYTLKLSIERDFQWSSHQKIKFFNYPS